MNENAFEMITDRLSHYSASKLERYEPVMIDANGKYAKATGARPFIGVVEYGVDNADEMVTIVKGIYPIIAGGDIDKGALLMIDTGTVKEAETGEIVIGVALAAATEGNVVSVQMIDPFEFSDI